jgi:hypothetical protein
MALALAQNKPTSTTGTNPTGTFTSTPAQGSLLIVTLVVADTLANVIGTPTGYTIRSSSTYGTVPWIFRLYSKIAGAGESTTVSWTDSNSVAYEIECMEFSGALGGAGDGFDAGVTGATGSGVTSRTPGSLTPAVGGELLVALTAIDAANGGSEAIDSSFNIVDAATFSRCVVGYKIKSAVDTAAENPSMSWTTAANARAVMAAFQPALPFTPMTRKQRQSLAVHRAATR